MGLTKQYLRYVPAGNANIIASYRCNVIFVTLEGQEGRFVASAACEHVFIWDLRLGEKAQVLSGEKVEVTHLAASPNKKHIAVGYADGTVKIFDLCSAENISIFVGHKSAITTLAYDALGHKLASGSNDTDIIVWDIVAETGICRLTGHKNVVTKLMFMKEHNILISSSKDTYVKFWDLDTEHNFKTLVGHRSEVWSFILVKDDKYLITGCNDTELRVWKITFVDNKNIEFNATATDDVDLNEESVDTDMKYPMRCEKMSSILKVGRGRVVSLQVDSMCKVIGCYGVGHTVELFSLVPDDKVKEKFAKRLKKKIKAQKEGKDVEKELPDAPTLEDEIKRLPAFKISSKIKGLDLITGKGNELRICVGADNNSIELHSLYMDMKDAKVNILRSLMIHGHRTDVRALCFSSDNLVFARLKITDPTAVPALPLAKDVHPTVVPISFVKQPEYVERVWDTAEAIGTRPFKDLNTAANKAIFKKGMLILSEAKVCYAQRAHIDKPDEDLKARKLYTEEELSDLNSMASTLPLPLAVYLECIGNVKQSSCTITPVLAEHANVQLSGAVTYAPRQLLPLLRILRAGVPIDGEVHHIAQALDGLPNIDWEEFNAVPIEGTPPRRAVRLTEASSRFWLDGDPGQEKISWTDIEYRIFVKIVKSLQSKKGFNVTFDLSHGNGTMAQTIQFADPWVIDQSVRWFCMYETSDYDVKIGAAFGFGHDGGTATRSRFRGYYETSVLRGEITPRRVMTAILSPQE